MWSRAAHEGDGTSSTRLAQPSDNDFVESYEEHFVVFTHEWPWSKCEGFQSVGEALLRARRWSHATPKPTTTMPAAAAAIAFGVG